ncbi:MAG: bile acid:sodium symporter family protein [Prevotella sp.]|nr:bile acid:sodium symporter family protein [Prevotella sp.]
MNTIFIVLPILVLLMFDLGLVLRPADFRLLVERPRAVLVGLVGQIVLLPLIGLAVAYGFHLEAVFFLGVMLIACSPGGSSSNVFSMLAGGDVALSVSLTMLSSIITLFTGPLVMSYATGLVGENQMITLPVGNLLVQNIVLMLVPILLGLALALWREQLAHKLHGVLKKLAFPGLVVLATTFFIQNRETIVREFPQLGLVVTVLILLSMAGGVLLSWLMRLSGREQRTIIIEIGMQNAAQAISIASSPFVFANDVMAIPAIVYALMMNVILLAYVGGVKMMNARLK